MLTAEELQKKKKREAELQWQKILAYYMMETYVMKAEALAEAEMQAAYRATDQFIQRHGLLQRLFEKKGDGPSPAELLMEIGKDEPLDSPLGELFFEMQKKPLSEGKLTHALTRVIAEEPPRMIADAQKERERRAEWEREHAKEAEAADSFELVDEEQVRYAARLDKKMAFLRTVMPPELYKELEQRLASGEYTFNADQLGAQEKQQEHKRDYQSYVKEKRVEPEEKAGKLANAGDVYSAAAYVIAAYEQKDAPEFDEAKADARAMEISGSRAFKVYMKGHPGNLLAAARGTAVEDTHDGIAALDADLSRRDAILTDVRDSLKNMATGKTPCFHQMLSALDRYVNADTEPSQQEKESLVSALGTYVSKDCAPDSGELDTACFTQAMRAVKALLPEKKFAAVLDMVNEGRAPKVKAEDFDLEIASNATKRQITEPQRILNPH